MARKGQGNGHGHGHARGQGKKSGAKGSTRNNATSSKPSFKDAIMDASRFLNKSSAVDNDDEDNSDVAFDDEELDSDEALGSDDDLDDYMAKKNDDDISLNQYGEEENGWESVDEGELMTLSEIWDRADKDVKKSKSKDQDQDEMVFDDDMESASEEEDDDDEEDGSDEDSDESGSESDSDSSEDEDADPFDEMNISDDEEIQLGSVLKNLKAKLPKNSKDKTRKLLVNDRTTENEFSLPTQGDSLTFDDMLGGLSGDDEEDGEGNGNDELIRDIAKQSKQLKELRDTELAEEELAQLNNDGNSAFAIPLPVNIQKRHERRAAYEIQKEQVNRWRDIINENRDKSVLKFIPAKADLDKNSAFKTDSDVAINDFESKLDSIIDASNIESKKTEDLFENIETAKLSKAEMIKRTNELRLMRELMYRGMKDSKRLKKIKSKAYRKQLRKEKMKEQALISQVNRADGNVGSDDEDQEDDPMYQRAKERMSLKHKNTSKWAKQMIKSGMSKDKGNRDEMEEMMRQGDRLKERQLGRNGEESSEDERNLSDLENDVEMEANAVDDERLAKVGKGVLAMDFMKNAEQRERLTKLKEIDDLRRFENNEDYREGFDGSSDANGVNVTINNGRRVYTPSALVAAEESRKIDEALLEELDEEDARLLKNRLSVRERASKKRTYESDDDVNSEDEKLPSRTVRETSATVEDDGEANPWLDDAADESESDKDEKVSGTTKIKMIDQTSSKLAKSGAKIAKNLSKRKAAKKYEEDVGKDVSVKIENKQTLQIVDPKKEAKRAAASKSDDEYESEGDDMDDNRMFKQNELIKSAFAGDDVLVEEFEQEKHVIEEEDDDKKVNLSVPGWGSWAGGDDDGWSVPKNKNKKQKNNNNNNNNNKRNKVAIIAGITAKGNRLDKGKRNVIINEKFNKRANKYQADQVPYPYKTWDEYERSLRVPMGKEWTTTTTHHKAITPSVITKFGSVIDPLKAPFTEN